ncbi:hypothetical protein COT72_05505 [archaeon CG10_big_fil_rev_8_21_14_0_10_43_11]|nr:MAG: hypothetical protein COT72_05505 [archaeon CG10_big_fil_rev_8_21_14_0_10_43_11]
MIETRVDMNPKYVVGLGVIGVFAVLLLGGATISGFFVSEPGKYDEFAQCLTMSGAKMYGTYYCGACTKQKAQFGSSITFVEYVECDLGNGQGLRKACVDKNIQSTPTWIFSDESRLVGLQPLDALAQKTGCKLPQ